MKTLAPASLVSAFLILCSGSALAEIESFIVIDQDCPGDGCPAIFPDFTVSYMFEEYDFSRNPTRADNLMRIQMSGRSSLRNYDFVGRVGGLSFEEITDFFGIEFHFDFDLSRVDGQHATITIPETK